MRKRSIPLGKLALLLLACVFILSVSACQVGESITAFFVSPTPIATATFTPTATATVTQTPTATATSTATVTPTATATATFTLVPTRKSTAAADFTASPMTCSGTNSSLEADVRALINQQRASVGLSSLESNSHLISAARDHSRDMAVNNYFSHYGNGDPLSRVTATGYHASLVGEVIFAAPNSMDNAYSAVAGWMNSAPHKEVLLTSGFTEIGVGYYCVSGGTYQGYYTVDFGKP